MKEDVAIMPFGAKHGVILGLVSVIFSLLTYVTGMSSNGTVGFLGFIIIVAFLIYAYKTYKNENDGFMSYGQALGLAVVICAVAGLLSGAFSAVYQTYVDPSLMDAQIEQSMIQMEEQGMSDEQIEAALSMTEMFRSPIFLFLGGMIGSVLIGFIVALIAGAFMKNPRPEFE